MKMRSTGFTLVELLVVVVITGILVAIALPNYVAAQTKSKTASMKGNMHTVQIAAEAFATELGGIYPQTTGNAATGCGPFFPGGNNRIGGTTGNYPNNPFTGAINVAPAAAGAIADRTVAASTIARAAGRTTFNPLIANGAAYSYAVEGGDSNGKAVGGIGGKCLVLSNQ